MKRSSRSYVSPHARQRAWERYGIVLTEKQCRGIYETIQRRKNVILLSRDKRGVGNLFACYFEWRWYLLGCGGNGTVKTFLPIDSLSEDEKRRLRDDPVYRRVGDDGFGLFSDSTGKGSSFRPGMMKKIPKPVRERGNRDRPIKELGESMDPFEFFMADELFFRKSEPVEIECPQCGRKIRIEPPEDPEIMWYTCRCGWEFSYDWE